MAVLIVGSNNLTTSERLLKAPPVKKLKSTFTDRTFKAIIKRLDKAVNNIDESASNGFTVFGMVLGEQSFLSKADYDFIWNHMYDKFGESDEAFNFNKRALGTLLMYCFAKNNRNWLCSMDPEKKLKLEKGEIPDAAMYFLDSTGKGYSHIVGSSFTLDDLASKFNKR